MYICVCIYIVFPFLESTTLLSLFSSDLLFVFQLSSDMASSGSPCTYPVINQIVYNRDSTEITEDAPGNFQEINGAEQGRKGSTQQGLSAEGSAGAEVPISSACWKTGGEAAGAAT